MRNQRNLGNRKFLLPVFIFLQIFLLAEYVILWLGNENLYQQDTCFHMAGQIAEEGQRGLLHYLCLWEADSFSVHSGKTADYIAERVMMGKPAMLRGSAQPGP